MNRKHLTMVEKECYIKHHVKKSIGRRNGKRISEYARNERKFDAASLFPDNKYLLLNPEGKKVYIISLASTRTLRNRPINFAIPTGFGGLFRKSTSS